MNLLQRYGKILLIVDTCQAGTLSDSFTVSSVPNLFFIGSSSKDENSYAHHTDSYLGVAVIDRYTRAILEFFQRRYERESTVKDFIEGTDDEKKLRARVSCWR